MQIVYIGSTDTVFLLISILSVNNPHSVDKAGLFLAVPHIIDIRVAMISEKSFYSVTESLKYFYPKKTINSFPPGQNGRHFAGDIFICIFVNENFCILINISLKFIPNGPIDDNWALV